MILHADELFTVCLCVFKQNKKTSKNVILKSRVYAALGSSRI